MADLRYKDASGGLTTVINTDATLADDASAAANYDNSTALDLFCIPFLTLQYDAGPPTAGVVVGELYILPGDAAASEAYPDDQQKAFLVGTFETINPSTTVDETLSLPMVPLYPHGNRFVFINRSGQTIDSTWQLDILPVKYESI